jgi:circadian clock protein KaiB
MVKNAVKKYVLRLYVSGSTLKSARAVANIKRVCERHLKNEYQLEVVDIYQQPHLAKEDQILAAPTLIKCSPLPRRRIVGDFLKPEEALLKLGLEF